jgi:hypothetical protein
VGSGIDLPEARARSAHAFTRLARAPSLVPSDRRSALSGARSLSAASRSLTRPDSRTPVMLGLGEPFSTSITIALALALLLGGFLQDFTHGASVEQGRSSPAGCGRAQDRKVAPTRLHAPPLPTLALRDQSSLD